jgi:hypothetical protein
MKINSIQIPLEPEIEQLASRLSDAEKKALSLIISAFVARPTRSISQVMDDMALYAKKQGLKDDEIEGLVNK